jgi:hypothetical protein
VPPPPDDPPAPLLAERGLEQPSAAQAVAQATIGRRRVMERPRFLSERMPGDYWLSRIIC